jgi:putative nucleotidyltransferase with HDIG domain
VRIDDLSKNTTDSLCGPAYRNTLGSALVTPLVEKDDVVGVLICLNKAPFAYKRVDEKDIELFASQAAIAIENMGLFYETKLNYLNTTKLLASVIDAKDTYTEDHSRSVTHSALAIAGILKLSERQKFIIRYASLLHDIGKIGVDISILRKPGMLGRREWAKMKRHPEIGVEIIKKAGFLDDLIPAILYHHVKFGGGGYPRTNRKKEAIPIEARILAVADAYEAMRSDRPYRKRLSRETAISELKRGAGSQFDPKVVRAFLRYLKKRS